MSSTFTGKVAFAV